MLSIAHLCAGAVGRCESTLLAGRYIYSQDLKELNRCSPGSQQPLPPELCQIHTPLISEQWSAQLEQHPDPDYCQYILSGIKDGFCIGYQYDSYTCRAAKRNMPSASENPAVVEQYLKKERELGRVVGPLTTGSKLQ